MSTMLKEKIAKLHLGLFLDEENRYKVVDRNTPAGDASFTSSPAYPTITVAVMAAAMRAHDPQQRWPNWHEEGSVLLFEYRPWIPPAGSVVASFCANHPSVLLREGIIGPNGERSTGLCPTCIKRFKNDGQC